MPSPKGSYQAVRLRPAEAAALKQAAHVEGRTMAGLVGVALRQYLQREQPKLAQRLYGSTT